MLRRALTVHASALLITLLQSPPYGTAQTISCGQLLTTYKSADARHNAGQVDQSCAGRGKYGLQYQCVEYIRRLYDAPDTADASYPNAGRHWPRIDAINFFDPDKATVLGLSRFRNGSTGQPPVPDDVIVFEDVTGVNPHGHVAVITNVGTTFVDIIEQNFATTGTARLSLVHDATTELYRIADRGSYRPLGWLRNISFDLALDSLRVIGNIPGGFFDEFDDDQLGTYPTSEFFSFSTVAESDGYVRLQSRDGANNFSPGFLTDNMHLGLQSQSTLVRDGQGAATITASFRADIPLQGEAYALQLYTFGSNDVNNVQVGSCGTGACVFGVSTAGFSAGVPVNLTGVSRIFLRLDLDDDTNTVVASFSTAGPNQGFIQVPLPQPARVFTSDFRAVVSVAGSVAIAGP